MIEKITKAMKSMKTSGEAGDDVVKAISVYFQSKPSGQLQSKVCQEIANLSKTETGRQSLTCREVIEPLISLIKLEDPEVDLQTFRAIANLMYENPAARGILHQCNGTFKLIESYTKLVESPEDYDEYLVQRLYPAVSACLFNHINDFERGIKEIANEKFINTLFKKADGTSFSILCCISYSESCKNLITKSLLSRVAKVLCNVELNDDNFEVVDRCMLIIHTAIDELKVDFNDCSSDIVNGTIRVLERSYDKTTDKLAFDITGMVLADDSSIKKFFDNGNGIIYRKLKVFIKENECPMKIMSAALCMCNLARNDENCLIMIEDGLDELIIDCLEKNSTIDDDMNVQHACLAALRNLSIYDKNKAILAKNERLIKLLLKLSRIPTHHVVFKLLGTIRLISKGQSEFARIFGEDKNFMKILIDLYQVKLHSSIEPESVRLLSNLIRYSKSMDVIENVIEFNGVGSLIDLVDKEIAIMRNEGILALILIANNDLSFEIFLKSDICKRLERSIERYSKRDSEIFSNMLQLIYVLARRNKKMRDQLIENGIDKKLADIPPEIFPEIRGKISRAFDNQND